MRFVDLGIVTPEYSVCADKVMLDSHRSPDDDILLMYSRDRPCISLGRFQNIESTVDPDYVKRNGISLIRRVSGGSNIYSDEHQVTYSLIISKDRLPPSREGSFAMICNAMVLALRELGIEGVHKPINDILVSGKKISGGAQARTRCAVLQHGSLILDVDDGVVRGSLIDTKERSYSGLTSVKECLGYVPPREEIANAVMNGFASVFGPVTRGVLEDYEADAIKRSADLLIG